MELTPLQLHYLKRELITEEIDREFELLKKKTQLTSLLQSATSNDTDNDNNIPFLQYLNRHFITEFPFLKRIDDNAFYSKLQTLLDEYRKVTLDTFVPKYLKNSQKRVLLFKIKKLMIISLAASMKTLQGKEESISVSLTGATESRLPASEEEDLVSRLDLTHLESEENYLEWIGLNGLKLNIITVRDVSEVRTIREHLHSEFIVETNLITNEDNNDGTGKESNKTLPPVYVARRHGHFRQLRDDLKAAYPYLDIPAVPGKARDPSYANNNKTSAGNANTKRLHREKDRILLRSFLRRLSADPVIAKSEILRDFLLNNAIELTEEEKQDAAERQKMDQSRVDEEKRFRDEVDKKIVELDGLLNMLKQKIMKPNGLVEVFDIIKKTETIEELPDELRKAIEWGRINLAFVLHTQFVTSDSSVDNVANLKRTHSLMPYRPIAQILKLSNPFAMIKGVLDLFLAQPLGRKSLFQRIVLTNMGEESKEIAKDIQELETKINDPVLCHKIANAVKTELPADEVEKITLNKKANNSITEILDLLKNPNIEPILSPEQILKVAFANQADKVEARALVQNLYDLWVLYAKKREQEGLMSLVFQGVTCEVIKDLFATFYEPLAQVYKSANIGDTVGHVASFIADLIEVIDQLDVTDVSNSAQPFVDLVQRHEKYFYQFVHNVHAQDQTKLFDNLLSYVDGMFHFYTQGFAERLDMQKVIEEAGISPNEYPELRKEIDAMCAYHRTRKQRHMERKRQKLMNTTDLAVDAQDMLDFLPNSEEVLDAFEDMDELEYNSDDEKSVATNSSKTKLAAHEMTLALPQLRIIPQIAPTFVKHATKIMH
ncbi:hypothetical protein BDF20DRAFT_907230 [Mycotypha africana]|uniref:uncharacterized protein n=1 Tax=Mycotypha africana TaxID=64632 RepID=UPI0023017241|nr:uncharacterized protein BDF20DRAFT_907230 [Mycotypha africana]KAI8971444.1 hypothetical protein BDF20DRAFT_907230 [Mycotypha africana]